MKCGKLRIALGLLSFLLWGLGNSSRAEALEPKQKYFVRANSTTALFPIFVYSKDECLATLQELLYPESKIAEGLQALTDDKIIGQGNTCLNETLKVWEKEISLYPVEFYTANLDGLFDPTRYYKLQNLKDCVVPYPEGSPESTEFKKYFSYKCNQWAKAEENDAILKEFNDEQAKYNAASRKASELETLAILVQTQLQALIFPDQVQLYELDGKLTCFNKYPSGSKDFKVFQEVMSGNCTGRWLTSEAREALVKSRDKIQREAEERSITIGSVFNDLRTLLARPYVMDSLDTNSMKDWVKQLHCYNPYSTESHYFEIVQKEKSVTCSGKWLTPDQAKDLRQKIFSSLGKDLGDAVENLRQIQKAKWHSAQLPKVRPNYTFGRQESVRRLLSRYQNFLNNNGSPDQAALFCAENAKQQAKDKAFFESVAHFWPFSVLTAKDTRTWEKVLKLGLSDSEHAALYHYLGSFYPVINSALYRGGTVNSDLLLYRDTLNRALSRFSAHRAGPVLRMATLPENVVQQHQVGKVVCYNSFTSTSKNADWKWEGQHHFVIYPGNRGHATYELAPGEGEVLFESGTCFKVLASGKKTVKSKEVTEFVMAEVDEKGEVIANLPEKLP